MLNKSDIKIGDNHEEEDEDNQKLIQANNLDINQKKEKPEKSQIELKVIDNESHSSLNKKEDQDNKKNITTDNNSNEFISNKNDKSESFFESNNKNEKENYYFILILMIIFILIIIIYFMISKYCVLEIKPNQETEKIKQLKPTDDIETNKDSNPSEKIEPNPYEKVEPNPSEKVEPNPSEKVEPNPSEKIEPNPSEKIEPNPSQKVEPSSIPTEEIPPVKKILDKPTIKKDFKVLVKQYEYLLDKNDTIPEDSPIWFMWYQGIKNAPALIKSCIQSVIINRANHPVYIVDQNNYKKYVDLPDYILKKFNDGKFSITHFSDIIRMALLAKHGGYWIDSTYFVTTPLTYDNYSLFTLKLSHCYAGTVTKCRWAGNFLGMPKNSFLSVYAYNAFLLYWKNYDKLIDYYLIDEIILVGFDNAPKLRTLIDKLPYITCNIFTLNSILSRKLKYSDLSCLFNKLNRRNNHQTSIYNGKTNYGYLIETYKLDYNNISNFDDCMK